MFLRKLIPVLLLAISYGPDIYGQQDNFCDAIDVIVRDAPNKFRNVKGKLTDANIKTAIWGSSIKVPGAIASRFISSMGLFYEGAFYQAKHVDSLKGPYEQLKKHVGDCLIPQGYTLTLCDNFYTGLNEYKKVVFIQQPANEDKDAAAGHVTIEVEYSKELGAYTIVLFIFEH